METSRRYAFVFILSASLLVGCSGSALRPGTIQASSSTGASEAIIDAFYSFDSIRLKKALQPAASAIPKIVFYQGWAQGGNYRIVERKPCRQGSESDVVCAITVKDDLIGALGINFNVTDTFRISFSGKTVSNVRTTSNDPPEFHEAFEWVQRERQDLIRKPCEGFFDGGPTPGDCVRAMVRGFAEFASRKR